MSTERLLIARCASHRARERFLLRFPDAEAVYSFDDSGRGKGCYRLTADPHEVRDLVGVSVVMSDPEGWSRCWSFGGGVSRGL